MKTIIPDTNTLMAIGQFKLDIFSELERICDFKYEIVVLDRIVEELEKIRKGKESAKLALAVIRQKGIKIIKTEGGHVDDILVELAKEEAIIITQDRELKERIKKADGKVMTIRQKKKIVFG
jgi:rRNA-processing protein FCF1